MLVTGLPLGRVQTRVCTLIAVEVARRRRRPAARRRSSAPRSSGGRCARCDRVAATAARVAELPLDRGEVALSERVPEADTDPRTEVGQVGAALNRMLDHVAAALAARQASETRVRQFVADASHELRTPLAAIRGYAELTRRGRDAVPPDVAHALGRVESESARMTDAGRGPAAAGPAGRRPAAGPATEVDLSALVVDAVSDAHAAGPEHRWRLDLPDEAATVRGDAARLHQVLANLLANARTHTPPGTTVTGSRSAHGDRAVLTVDRRRSRHPARAAARRVRALRPRRLRRARAQPAAPVSAWPSSRPWWRRTAARSTWPAGPGGPASPCGCRLLLLRRADEQAGHLLRNDLLKAPTPNLVSCRRPARASA